MLHFMYLYQALMQNSVWITSLIALNISSYLSERVTTWFVQSNREPLTLSVTLCQEPCMKLSCRHAVVKPRIIVMDLIHALADHL